MKSTEKNKVLGGVLYIVATPIGNLADISERALKVLSEVDFIAAEDTRNSMRLLTHFGISKPLVSYYEHNKREKGAEIVARLTSGESCALITDAGTPAISDPGEDLVRLCAENSITVTSIPGACAMITALTLSALPTARFVFEGFLPVPKKERNQRIEALARRTLGDNRKIAICRELTKLNEEIFRTTLAEACATYSEREPRGEYVLVIEGGELSAEAEQNNEWDSPEAALEHFLSQGMSRNDAIKAAAKAFGVTRNQFYGMLIEK